MGLTRTHAASTTQSPQETVPTRCSNMLGPLTHLIATPAHLACCTTLHLAASNYSESRTYGKEFQHDRNESHCPCQLAWLMKLCLVVKHGNDSAWANAHCRSDSPSSPPSHLTDWDISIRCFLQYLFNKKPASSTSIPKSTKLRCKPSPTEGDPATWIKAPSFLSFALLNKLPHSY